LQYQTCRVSLLFLLFSQAELKMCSRNHHTDRSFKLDCFEAEGDVRSEVYELHSTTELAEEVSVYYRVGRGADKPVGWLICPEGFAPESLVVKDKARRRP